MWCSVNKILKSEIIPPKKEEPLVEAIRQAFENNPNTITIRAAQWLTGTGEPKKDDGVVGDFYLENSLGNIFQKKQEGWEKQGNLKGFKGDEGDRGPQGDKGDPGERGLMGLTGRTGLTGRDGINGKDGKNGEDGKDGREIELRRTAKDIEWHYVGERNWQKLISIEELRGPAGTNAIIGGGGGGGILKGITAGANITIDNSNPENPIISASDSEDGDLTAIAALTPDDDDFIQRKDGAWTNRSAAQVKADLITRIGTVASSAAPTPNADNHDQYNVTALAAGATFGAPTGEPTEGQSLVIRVKDNGTARALAFNAVYRAVGVTLPTTTVINKTLYLGFKWNDADETWDCLATAQEA